VCLMPMDMSHKQFIPTGVSPANGYDTNGYA
jgi:hypothetical protein